MTQSTNQITLRTLLGNTPRVEALKSGAVSSPLVKFDFANVVPVTDGFPAMVRDQAYDFGELAFITYLQAKAAGKPLVLLPAVLVGQYLHEMLIYNTDRGQIAPADLAGKRIGVRSYTQTTGVWVRGVLQHEYGLWAGDMEWIRFQDPHVLEYQEPEFVRRAPADKSLLQMLLDGEIDAGVGVGPGAREYPQLQPVIPDAKAAAAAWGRKHGLVPINHMAVVSSRLYESRPDLVPEFFRLLAESKAAAPALAPGVPDANPFGVEANRKSMELAIQYAFEQQLIPRRFEVDEIFDDLTRKLSI